MRVTTWGLLALGLCSCARVAEPVVRETVLPRFGEFELPVDPGTQIGDPFGPRELAGADDFHLGIDFEDAIGSPLYAIADGEVTSILQAGGSSTSNILFIEHTLDESFVWQQTEIERFYAVYTHVDSFDVAVGDEVEAGDVVARMGDVGVVGEPHLHFEIRLQTHCSLEYQIENPTSGCALGFDPRINPYHMLPGAQASGLTMSFETKWQLLVRAERGSLVLNRIETDLGIVDFDQKLGFPGGKLAEYDDFDFDFVKIEPQLFNEDSSAALYTVELLGRPTYVEVLDIFGHGRRWQK